jgi:hypothetical protein
MAQIVVSLRRQNDDLRQKLQDAKELNNKTIDNSGLEKEEQLRKLAEKECDELRTTVSRLERLIKIEREERSESEKQTLQLLEDVKKKWHERTEDRVQKMRSDLQAANTVVQQMEIDMMKNQSDLEAQNQRASYRQNALEEIGLHYRHANEPQTQVLLPFVSMKNWRRPRKEELLR